MEPIETPKGPFGAHGDPTRSLRNPWRPQKVPLEPMALYGALLGSGGPYGVSIGLCGVSVGIYVALWGSVGPYGILRGSMVLYRVPIWLCASLWGSVGLYGSLWVPMGSLCVSACPHGVFVGLYGSLCVPMCLCGITLCPYGSLWVSMGSL